MESMATTATTFNFKAYVIDALNIRLNKNGKMALGGVREVTPRQFEKESGKVWKKLKEDNNMDAILNVGTMLKKFNDDFTQMSDALYGSLMKDLKGVIVEKLKREVEGLRGENYDYYRHGIMTDVVTSDKIVFDLLKVEATGLKVETLEDYIKTLSKEDKIVFTSDSYFGLVEYAPFKEAGQWPVSFRGQTINKFNSHATPDWRKQEIIDPERPEDFHNFMKHLFPDEQSLDYVYHWMHFMLASRNNVHLLLHGRKGIGKNTFSEICEQLVGRPNFKLIDPKFWDSRFNGELKNRRLCFFDEHNITKDNIAQFKAYANTYISIEEKNKNTETDNKNFASYIIANNNPQGNAISADDRRFSVPITSIAKLSHSFSEEAIDALYIRIQEDEEFIAQIGWWLIKKANTGRFDNQKPLKTALFYDLVEMSMSEWKRSLISLIEKREYEFLPLDFVTSEISGSRGIAPGRTKIAEFLDNHTDEKNRYYGQVKQRREGGKIERGIVPSEHLMPEKIETDYGVDPVMQSDITEAFEF